MAVLFMDSQSGPVEYLERKSQGDNSNNILRGSMEVELMIDEISNIKERLGKLEAQLAAMNLRQSMGSRRPREFSDVRCSDCGKETRVPFKVRFPNKPIYCRTCWEKHKAERR